MSKDKFISFARNHTELANEVLKGNVSWQQLYELYEIYGENHSVWNRYLKGNTVDLSSFQNLVDMIQKVDLNHVQEGIQNIQKTIGYLQDIGIGNRRGQ